MADAGVSIDLSLKQRALAARAAFKAQGVNASDWARQEGFSPKLVHLVLSGTRPCNFGDSHKIAIALGIKPPAAELVADAA